MALMPVEEALARLLASVPSTMASETVALAQSHGRILAENVVSLRTQPPFPASAMDGYAVRAADLSPGATLCVIGESAAGRRFSGVLKAGEAVRIFTGAPVPDGADTILIQENADGVGSDTITAKQGEPEGRFVRKAGLDFLAGDVLLKAGQRLQPGMVALAAAMGHGTLPVRRKPRVAILATGDELVMPGDPAGLDQIMASNSFALAGIVAQAGGAPLDLGIARDNHADLARAIGEAQAQGADVLVTLGGASVGDHDLVQAALLKAGMTPGFWKIAMRPGKPLMQGRLGQMVVVGLPGNPVSSIVCGHVFVVPLVRAMLGLAPNSATNLTTAKLGT
ncbi:MAG: molybdopterin molybdotransferase MoeA, partial [Bosea sp. (in: a-proteobacteria)]